MFFSYTIFKKEKKNTKANSTYISTFLKKNQREKQKKQKKKKKRNPSYEAQNKLTRHEGVNRKNTMVREQKRERARERTKSKNKRVETAGRIPPRRDGVPTRNDIFRESQIRNGLGSFPIIQWPVQCVCVSLTGDVSTNAKKKKKKKKKEEKKLGR